MTAKTVIQGAYRLLGNLRHGQTASDDALTDGLSMLNDMLDSWAIERMTVPVIVRRVVDVAASTASYLVGPGGDWDIEPPIRIERAGLITTDGLESPIAVLTVDQWADVALKSGTSTQPTSIYYDKDSAVGRVYVTPIPTSSGLQIALYNWQAFSAFADIDTTNYDFPPGAALALRYCLAELLIPESIIQNKALPFGGPQYGHIIEQARTLKGRFKAFNAPVLEMGFDKALTTGYWDIETGVYR